MADLTNTKPTTGANAPTGAQVEATKANPPTPSQFELRPPRFWLIFGTLVVVLLAGLGLFLFTTWNRQKPNSQAQNVPVFSPSISASPVALQAIKKGDQANFLKEYFLKASPHFRDDFMENIPEMTANAYQRYLQVAEGEEKLEAARAFYIYLNNPGPKHDDPSYVEFTNDVREDLENTLGRKLFGD